jgi:hypothetical protein
VKPWLLPNLDPSSANPIFDTTTGAIGTASLLGLTGPPLTLATACSGAGGCTLPLGAPPPWNYYPGDPGPASFPPPNWALPTCGLVATPSPYQESIAGCIQKPVSCNQTVTIDTNPYSGSSSGALRGPDTSDAVNCLTHASPNNGGDQVTSAAPPVTPFEFVAGADNPIPGVAAKDVMVSDSLVTVPVFDSTTTCTATPCIVTIVGFVQLFLNPDGSAAPATGVNTTVINLAGCGTDATAQAILGNGASPVAVRLISP